MKGTLSFENDNLPQPIENRAGYSVWEWKGVKFLATSTSHRDNRFTADVNWIEPSNQWTNEYTRLAFMTDAELLQCYNHKASDIFDGDNLSSIIQSVLSHYDNSLDLFNEVLSQEATNPKLASEILSAGYYGFEGVAQAILYRLICAGAFSQEVSNKDAWDTLNLLSDAQLLEALSTGNFKKAKKLVPDVLGESRNFEAAHIFIHEGPSELRDRLRSFVNNPTLFEAALKNTYPDTSDLTMEIIRRYLALQQQ